MKQHRELPVMEKEHGLDRFITEHLKNGTLTTEVLLQLCSLQKLKKRYFNMLLDAGVDMHGTDDHGRDALFCAAESGNLVLLRALLEQGLNPMRKDDSGEIPLSAAVRCGNLSVAECLLGRTKNLASVVDNEGSTLLHKAAWGDVPDIARRLIDVYDIPPEVRDNDGRTAVHVAAYQGSCKMLKYLLKEKCVDVNAADNDGRTPLFSGAYDGNLRALKILCEQGADLSMKDKSGLTVREFALGRKEFNAAKFLSGQLNWGILQATIEK